MFHKTESYKGFKAICFVFRSEAASSRARFSFVKEPKNCVKKEEEVGKHDRGWEDQAVL